MAEYIERESLLKDLELLAKCQPDERQQAILGVRETIRMKNAADVQEVVRCRECACFEQDTPTGVYGYCFPHNRMTKVDNFCSWAKRKDDTNAVD